MDYTTFPDYVRPGYADFTIAAIKNTALAIAYEDMDAPASSKQEILSQLLKKASEMRDRDEIPRRPAFQVLEDFLLKEISEDPGV